MKTRKRPDIDDPNLHCSCCDRKFPIGVSYRNHLRSIHHISRAGKDAAKHANTIPDINNPKFQCVGCKYNFRQKEVIYSICSTCLAYNLKL